MLFCSSTLKIPATVNKIVEDRAYLSINEELKKTCSQCDKKGGCQSLSISSLFLKNKPITIYNQNFHIGENIEINFPSSIIIASILLLMGLPFFSFLISVILLSNINELLGFILGLIVMFASYLLARNHMIIKLISNISYDKSADN